MSIEELAGTLDDDAEYGMDNPVFARIFGGRPPVAVDPATGQPVPRQPRFTGEFIKNLVALLPQISGAIPQIMEIWSLLSPLFAPKPTT